MHKVVLYWPVGQLDSLHKSCGREPGEVYAAEMSFMSTAQASLYSIKNIAARASTEVSFNSTTITFNTAKPYCSI
jgi:hypothetical protein